LSEDTSLVKFSRTSAH